MSERQWSPMSPETTIQKNQELTSGDFGAPYCSCFFSCSYSCSYSTRSSIAIRPIGPQLPANLFDQRSASPQFKQPSSTSTVRRGGLSTASLSTSTTKSDAMHEPQHSLCRRGRTTISTGLIGDFGAWNGSVRFCSGYFASVESTPCNSF